MNQLEFQAQVMKLCWEMAEMGRNSQIPFDDLERIADRRAWQLTSEHSLYVGIMHLCECMATGGRDSGMSFEEMEFIATEKVQSLSSQREAISSGEEPIVSRLDFQAIFAQMQQRAGRN